MTEAERRGLEAERLRCGDIACVGVVADDVASSFYIANPHECGAVSALMTIGLGKPCSFPLYKQMLRRFAVSHMILTKQRVPTNKEAVNQLLAEFLVEGLDERSGALAHRTINLLNSGLRDRAAL